ncbi:HAMP domain-containing protein [Azoarcus sp. TTM-91]|uniref:methyl-accepting chemotaxis protein n=1 Tax=Azoarcus sp. TTM-91 TaxID=2691581 RepID=UPI00145C8FD8|nr:Cache 3/Cache 2 fusion domain-containing protein [Azoarcus sp. TTM-91]NMG36183.1 HAMP domain-containing protein [Azoarcus sp. TTM-91]
MYRLGILARFALFGFLPLTIALVLGAVVLAISETNRIGDEVALQSERSASAIINLLQVTDTLTGEQVQTSMKLFRDRSAMSGPAALAGRASIAGREVPALFFGGQAQTDATALVDQVTAMAGGTATLFVRDGKDFVRIATNVLREGKRAVGTVLDPQGAAWKALTAGQAYYGQVGILGSPYLTGYEPIRNGAGEIIGAWYVGFKADLPILKDQVGKAERFGSGFVALLDDKGQPFLWTAGQDAKGIANRLTDTAGWTVQRQPFPAWGFAVAVGSNDAEVRMAGWTRALPVLIGGLLFAAALLALLTLVLRRVVLRPVQEAMNAANALAEGDLTVRIEVRSGDEVGQLLAAMQNMVAQLSRIIGEIRSAADNLSSASEEVSSTAQSLSQGASEQAASVEQISSTLEETTASVVQNTENAKITDDIASKAAGEASEGGSAVKETVTAMQAIAEKIGIVDDIAYQTNLLALNAAIEAARAGEHGKGFAVVATEVRKLAERSQVAAREIRELAGSSVKLADKAGHLLEQMLPSIRKTSELVQEISSASEEQSTGVSQINQAIGQLNQVTQHSASASEELAATSEEMGAQAQQLQELMLFFRTRDDGTVGARQA